jgi:flagellin-like protein
MWIMGRHFNNRAVSAVIATLLLIAIAVAAAIIVYVFSIGLLGGLQTSGGQQVKQQVIMEAYNWATTTQLILTLRNVGPAKIEFQDYFVNGIIATTLSGGCGYSGNTLQLGVGASCTETVTPPSSPSVGVAYVIKIISVDGAVFSYSAIAGSAS